MQAVAGLLLLFTGEAAPALAAIAKVQGGLLGLQGTVAESSGVGLLGGLAKVGAAAVVALGVASAAIATFGIIAARKFVEAGEAAYLMSEKFGIAKAKASEWIAVGQLLGVNGSAVGMGFRNLARALQGLDLANDTAKLKEYNKELVAGTAKQREAARAALVMAEAGRPLQQILNQLKVHAFDAHGRMRDLNDILLDVADAFQKGLVPANQKAGIAMRLFGRSGTEMIPILNEGRAGIAALIAKAKEMGATMTDAQVITAHKAFLAQQELNVAWQGASDKLGMYFLPALTATIRFLADRALPAVVGLAQALKPVTDGVGAFIEKLMKGEEPFAAFGDVMHLDEGIMVPLGSTFQSLKGSVESMIGSVIRIVKAFGPEKDGLLGVWRQLYPTPLLDIVKALGTGLANALKTVADHMDILKPILYTIAIYWGLWNVEMALTKGMNLLGILPSMIAKLVIQMSGLSAALDVLGISWTVGFWPALAIVALIAGIILIGVLLITHWNELSTLVKGFGELLGTFFVKVWQLATRAIGDFFNQLGTRAHNVLMQVGGLFSLFGKTVHDIWDKIVKVVTDAAKAFWEKPYYWIALIVLWIPGQFYQLQMKLTGWVTATVAMIWKWGGDVFNAVGTWLSKLPGAIYRWLADVVAQMVKWSKDLAAWASRAAAGVWAALSDFFSHLPARIGAFLAQVVEKAIKFKDAFALQIGALIGQIWHQISSTNWGELGGKIIGGIIGGIKALATWVAHEIGTAASQIIQAFKDAFGIKSPAQVMIAIGIALMQGLAAGISAGLPLVLAALAGIKGMVDAKMGVMLKVPGIATPVVSGAKVAAGAGAIAAIGGLHIGSMVVNNPAADVDVVAALQRQQYLARMGERGISPAPQPI